MCLASAILSSMAKLRAKPANIYIPHFPAGIRFHLPDNVIIDYAMRILIALDCELVYDTRTVYQGRGDAALLRLAENGIRLYGAAHIPHIINDAAQANVWGEMLLILLGSLRKPLMNDETAQALVAYLNPKSVGFRKKKLLYEIIRIASKEKNERIQLLAMLSTHLKRFYGKKKAAAAEGWVLVLLPQIKWGYLSTFDKYMNSVLRVFIDSFVNILSDAQPTQAQLILAKLKKIIVKETPSLETLVAADSSMNVDEDKSGPFEEVDLKTPAEAEVQPDPKKKKFIGRVKAFFRLV